MTRHDPRRGDLIVAAIRRSVNEHGYPPTIRELMPAVGLSSTSAIHYQLGLLEKAGRIEWDRGVARGLRIAHDPVRVCPTCGRAA